MKHLTIPLTDAQWRTLKELATLRKMAGGKPDSITQLILEPLADAMRGYEAELRGVRKRHRK